MAALDSTDVTFLEQKGKFPNRLEAQERRRVYGLLLQQRCPQDLWDRYLAARAAERKAVDAVRKAKAELAAFAGDSEAAGVGTSWVNDLAVERAYR